MSYVKIHDKIFRRKDPHSALNENECKTGSVEFVSMALDVQPWTSHSGLFFSSVGLRNKHF